MFQIKSLCSLIVFVAHFCFSPMLYAQKPVAELLKELALAQHDMIRLDCYLGLANTYVRSNLDSSAFYLSKAEPLVKNYLNTRNQIRFLNTSGTYHRYRRNHSTALDLYEKAAVVAKMIKDTFYIKAIRFNRTEVLRISGKNHLAVKELLALEEFLKNPMDSGFLRSTYGALVSNYNDLEKIDKAVYYLGKSWTFVRTKRDSMLYYTNLSSINTQDDSLKYLHQKKIDLFPACFAIAKEFDDIDAQQTMLTNASSAYINNKDFVNALTYAEAAAKLIDKRDEGNHIAHTAQTFGRIYHGLRQYNKAISYYKQAIQGYEGGDKKMMSRALEYISQTYLAIGDYKNAYLTFVKSTEIKEELSGDKRQKIVAELETQYDLNEKQQQIAEKELENRLQEERLNSLLRQKYIYAGLFALVTGLFFWALWNYRQKNKFSETLTEQKTALETQTLELQKLNEVKDKLFAVIAHDLRQPALAFQKLGSAISQLIQKKDMERLEKVSQYAQSMSTNLHLTIENLFQWGALQHRKMLTHENHLDLSALVKDVCSEFAPIAEAKQIDFQVAAETSAFLTADSSILTSILRNVLSNAVKFTPQGNKIDVALIPQGKAWIIEVNDAGIGIPADIQADFFELNPTKKREGTGNESGSGLGLALCKQLSDLAKFDLSFTSKVGEGTTVKITCPA